MRKQMLCPRGMDEKLCHQLFWIIFCERIYSTTVAFSLCCDFLVSRLPLVRAPPIRDQDTTSYWGQADHYYHGNKITIGIFL